MSIDILARAREALERLKVKNNPMAKHIPDREALLLWLGPMGEAIIIDPEAVLKRLQEILLDPSIADKRSKIIEDFDQRGWGVIVDKALKDLIRLL